MMIARQLSVFLENKPGRLCTAGDALAQNGINISALTLADTTEFGILRLLVDQPDRAREVLSEIGVVVRITDVLAIAMDDAPGGAGGILHHLAEAGLSVEYMYACVGQNTGRAIMVMQVSDLERAEAALRQGGFETVDIDQF